MRNLYTLLPNEDLMGFVGRIHYLGPFQAFEDTRQRLGLTTRLLKAGEVTYKDEYKVSQLLGHSLESLASKHTSRNLLRYCMTLDELNKFSDPSTTNKMPKITFFDSKSVVKLPWRWCPECVDADVAEFGCSYYHRNHQLLGVHTCYKHGCLLYSECKNCDFRIDTIKQAYVPPLDNKCPCCGSTEFLGQNYISDKMYQVESYVLLMAEGKLDLNFERIAASVCEHIGINEQSILARTGGKSVRAFNRRMLNFFGLDDLSQYFSFVIEYNDKLKCRTLCNSRTYDIRFKYTPAHPVVYAMLLVYLEHHHHHHESQLLAA